jgi:multicomponent K+:H+ antiporter subunit E
MIRRLLPHPYLSLVLIAVWMLLVNRWAVGSLVFAVILGVVIPLMTAPYWPDTAKLKSPGRIPGYLAIVLHDIVKANFDVARIVLFKPRRDLQPAWIVIPLELTRGDHRLGLDHHADARHADLRSVRGRAGAAGPLPARARSPSHRR